MTPSPPQPSPLALEGSPRSRGLYSSLDIDPENPASYLDRRSRFSGIGRSSSLRSSSSSSSLARNYHAEEGHEAFSSSPQQRAYDDNLYRTDNKSPLLPLNTPPRSPNRKGDTNPFDQHYSSPKRMPSQIFGSGMHTRQSSATHQPSKLGLGFSPYGMGASATADGRNKGAFTSISNGENEGEDKMTEKMRASGADGVYGRAGMDPIAGTGDGKTGKYASMLPEQAPPQTPLEHAYRLLDHEHFCTALYFVLALITRLYRIGKSPTVIWDEAHFGKFGSHYLQHEFYFDVHPPLGKMLVGLAGLLSGYNGSFEFKSGESYPEGSQYYVGMRIILALFGVAMVPVAWSSSGALGWNKRSRHLLAIMVLCDNAWLVISRFILLDSMLLCFTFTTVHGLLMFHQQQRRPFSSKWWFWLTFTGLSIGCVMSVKWVGLFVMSLVGLYTIEDLWDRFGDLKMPVRTYLRHWCARALCLLAIPLTVYLISFKLHFMILSHSGPGDAQMSSLFQAHLKGNDFADSPLEVAYGSRLTFKNMGYGGGLLHSHVQTYPVGSQQQQVTCYHYKDNNNEFIVTPVIEQQQLPAPGSEEEKTAPLRMLRNGDTIRLRHVQTGRNLHSHKVAAPVTKENYEVSAYGNDTVSDSNDYWVVEMVDDMHQGKAKLGMQVQSLTSRIRFRHQNQHCYLRAANAVLPQWGWKQVEVSCDKENNPKDEHTYWNVESHWNDRLPAGNTKLYKSPFLRDFIHLNVAMMTSNNALVPDADKEDLLASMPFDWPLLWNGLRMNSWADSATKYYLIGNPVIWWGSTVSIFVYLFTLLFYLARMQRRHADLSPASFNQFVFVGKIGFIGWFLHFLPFTIMARVCYIHHYLPTLYFACILYVHVLDHFLFNDATARYKFIKSEAPIVSSSVPSTTGTGTGTGSSKAQQSQPEPVYPDSGLRRPVSNTMKNILFLVIAGAIVGTFAFFHKTALGIDGPVWKYAGRKWRNSWNIYD